MRLFSIACLPCLRQVNSNDGVYNFKKVRPGTYSVSVTAKGYVKKVIDEVVIEDGRTSELDVELDRVVEELPEPEGPGLPEA